MKIERRQQIERMIALAAAKGLIAAGYAVTVFDGEDEPLQASTDVTAIDAALFACDIEWLFAIETAEGGGRRVAGIVQLVYGNDGWNVINDYSGPLEMALQEAEALAEQAERQYA